MIKKNNLFDKNIKLILSILLLSLIFYVISFITQSISSTLETVTRFKSHKPSNNQNIIESYIKQAEIKIYEQSFPKYRITSPYIENNEQLNYALLDKPQIAIYKSDVKNTQDKIQIAPNRLQTKWFIQADTGKIYLTSDKINLEQHVQIKQMDRHVKLSTDNLDIWPEKSFASNRSLVNIETTSETSVSTTTAKGIKFDLNNQNYQLLSQVKMMISPKH